MTEILDQFEALTSRGLKVIPLHPASKVPMYKKWNRFWSKDYCFSILTKTPKANLGLLLGKVMDVEGDTDEANSFLNSLLKDIPHPCYSSAKSFHHLFLNPFPDLTICRYRGIEFRAKNHQSVLPPSCHKDGTSYEWVSQEFPIPSLPSRLLQLLEFIPRRKDLKPGHTTWLCSICKNREYIHEKRLELEKIALKSFGLQWMCRKCRTIDLRPICKKLRVRGHARNTLSPHS